MCLQLINFCKKNEVTCFIIGQITKDGSIAGPKVLEHMVDSVFYFEKPLDEHLRILKCEKNRFGDPSRILLLNMNQNGLEPIGEKRKQFMNQEKSYGVAYSLMNFRNYSFPLEVQALVKRNTVTNGKRSAQGYDLNRLHQLVSVIEHYLDLTLWQYDVYINVLGIKNISIENMERADLAVIAAILSSLKKRVLGKQLFIGEVDLLGNVRKQDFKASSYFEDYNIILNSEIKNGKNLTNILGLQSLI